MQGIWKFPVIIAYKVSVALEAKVTFSQMAELRDPFNRLFSSDLRQSQFYHLMEVLSSLSQVGISVHHNIANVLKVKFQERDNKMA